MSADLIIPLMGAVIGVFSMLFSIWVALKVRSE